MGPTSFHRVGSLRGIAVSALLVTAFLLAPGTADAATIVVNTTDESPSVDCPLRDAITAANDNVDVGDCPGGDPGPTVDLIDIIAIGTINATSQLPILTDEVEIQGEGADLLDVHRSDTLTDYSLFSNQIGNVATISGLQVSNGLAPTGAGGGISNGGTMTLDGVRVTGNAVSETTSTADSTLAVQGGGILNGGGAVLTVRNSEISGNTATATNTGTGASRANVFGAGIFNSTAATLTIEDSAVSGNTATASDTSTDANTRAQAYSGIANLGTLTLARSTVSGNVATATQAGAASNSQSSATGAIILTGPTTVELSTIADNSATATGGLVEIAFGGVWNGGNLGALTASSSTISGNSGAAGANLVGTGTPAETVVANTIVADPVGGSNCNGAITSNGHNLEDGSAPGTCDFAEATDLHADPLLAGLASNGGPTQTIALDVDSPAIDAGASTGETTDQRGEPRPFDFVVIPNAGGDASDIGAFELQGPLAIEAKLTSNKKRVREGNKAKLKVKVTPCPVAAGDKAKLYLGSKKVGTKTLNDNCKATFREKIKRKSKFKAKIAADSDHNKDTSNKVTVKIKQ